MSTVQFVPALRLPQAEAHESELSFARGKLDESARAREARAGRETAPRKRIVLEAAKLDEL